LVALKRAVFLISEAIHLYFFFGFGAAYYCFFCDFTAFLQRISWQLVSLLMKTSCLKKSSSHLVEQTRLLAAWVESCAFSDRMFGDVVQPTVFHFEVTIAYSAISKRCALSGLCKPATKSFVVPWFSYFSRQQTAF
jgi:hypothetical protein